MTREQIANDLRALREGPNLDEKAAVALSARFAAEAVRLGMDLSNMVAFAASQSTPAARAISELHYIEQFALNG